MKQNVGPNERIGRLAVGAAAGAAALRAHGWQRAALCGVSTAGFLTGLTRYCPINSAIGIDNAGGAPRMSRDDEQATDTEIRRQTQTAGAMGERPGTTSPAPTAY